MSQPNQNRHLQDLSKKHYCLNCHVHLLERFDFFIFMYNRGYKDIAVGFCFWWYLHHAALDLLQWAEGTCHHDTFLRSHLFLHSRSWLLLVLVVQHIQPEIKHIRPEEFVRRNSEYSVSHINQLLFMQFALSSKTGERGHSCQYLLYIVFRHM